MTDLRQTPFAPRYGAGERETIDIYGFAIPLWFEDPEAEYRAIREAVGLLDFAPLLKVDVEGPGAREALNALVARDLSGLEPGRIAYGPLVDERGMMVDDCTVMLMAEDRLRVVGGPGMPGQVVPFAQARGLRATPRRDDLAHLTVQGPNSRALLARLTDADMSNEAFPYYTFREAMSVAGVETFVTRLGFTAELGYELFIPADRALEVWDTLVREGAGLGVRPVGAAAILTARTEAGMVMGELEYDGSVSPYECLLGWAVDLEKGDFQGREALVKAREDAPNRTVTVVLDEGGEAATGARLLAGGRDTGHVTMAVVSPHLDGATLGLARVRREDAAPGTRLDAVLEDGTRTGAEVRRTPVYDPERTRVRS